MIVAPTPRRPRPVPGLPEVDGVALAKGWLIELIVALPLRDAGRIPAADLAREAPGLFTAAALAVGDDVVLGALGPGGRYEQLAARTGALAGATDAPTTLAAGEALRQTLTAALRAQTPADLHGDIAERVAHVASTLVERSLVAQAAERDFAAGAEDDAPPLQRPPAPLESVPDVRVRDARSDVTVQELVGRAFARRVQDGRPFAVFAVEVVDAERWQAADPSGAVVEGVEAAVSGHLRPGDRLVGERSGRFWVVAPDTDRDAARNLAAEFASVVAGSGSPARAAFGVAACPDDGTDADELLASADEGLFAALAAGVAVSP